jgi:DNA-binding GntR family transcriptional regulator
MQMNSFWQPSDDNSQERAYQFIKEAIIGFQLKPEQRLVASELAAALGLSRTPIREALSRLEQEGLVMRAGGWGYLVRAMRLADVLELFKVREALEVEAIGEALPNLDQQALQELRLTLGRAKKFRQQAATFVALTRSFHNQIAAATRNELLRYMLSFISDRVQMIGIMTVAHHTQRVGEVLEENHEILRALEKKDAAAAKAAIRAHVRRGRDHAVRILERNGGRFMPASAL